MMLKFSIVKSKSNELNKEINLQPLRYFPKFLDCTLLIKDFPALKYPCNNPELYEVGSFEIPVSAGVNIGRPYSSPVPHMSSPNEHAMRNAANNRVLIKNLFGFFGDIIIPHQDTLS